MNAPRVSRRGRRLASLRARLIVALGLGAGIGLLSFGGMEAGFLNGYRLQATDALQPTGAADEDIVVVAIDARSLGEVQLRWPWPRRLHADLVRELAGAKQIVYDVLFQAPSEGDDELAAAVEESNVVLSSAAERLEAMGAGLYEAEGLAEPVERLARRAVIGHSNVTPDPADGVVRSLPLVVETAQGDLVPTLSFAALMQLEGLREPLTTRPRSVVVGERVIPTGPRATLEIAYAPDLRIEAEEEAPIISAVDVIRGRVPRSKIEGKIVLIGVTDPALGDDRPTPVAKGVEMPGVLIHANALNTMLTERYLEPAGNGPTGVAAGALGGFVALGTLMLPVLVAPFVMVIALGAYVLWTFIQFDAGTVLDLIYPPLALALAFVAALGVRYFTELRARRRVSTLFSQYVPKEVANDLLASGRFEDAIRGERLVATVLFCDLRGFTATSAQLEAGQVRDLLNVFYDETARLVYDNGGTLLAYVGDEVLAAWGAPMPDADGAAKGVRCARALQDACSRINERLAGEGLPPITFGIGAHTGEIIAAHVGSDIHRQYTILGDTVNCASRLCTIAGRNEIVVSAETYASLDGKPPAQVLPGIRLKGVGRDLLPHRLWPEELRDPTGEERRGKLEA